MGTNSGPIQLRNEFGVTRREMMQITGAAFAAPWLSLGTSSQQVSASYTQPVKRRTARAIVIGIDGYEVPQFGALPNCVAHAHHFTEWLIQAGVDKTDIVLLTKQPGVATPFGDPDVKCEEATEPNLQKWVNDFFCRPGSEGERLYFFFSGHGLLFKSSFTDNARAVEVNRARDVIVLEDGRPIFVDSLYDIFGSSNYVEQFYFIDACREIENRNLPLSARSLDQPQNCSEGARPEFHFLSQCDMAETRTCYVMNATQPNRAAPANSFVTTKLLASLSRGAGACIDAEGGKFMLRWNRLRAYLEEYFRKNPYRLGDKDYFLHPDFVQVPPCSNIDPPCLMEFAANAIEQREVQIAVQTVSELIGAQYSVTFEQDGTIVGKGPVPTNGRFGVLVGPGIHSVEVTLKDGTSKHRSFDPDDPVKYPPPLFLRFGNFVPISTAGGSTPSADVVLVEAMSGGSGELLVESSDPWDQLQLFDGFGKPVLSTHNQISTALGGMKVSRLPPGAYRAVCKSTFGTTERFTAVSEGEKASIVFRESRSSAFSSDLENRVGWTSAPHRALGPGAFLAQALRATDNQADAATLIAKNLGVAGFAPEVKQGLRIVLGVNLDGPNPNWDSLKQVVLLTGSLDQDDLQPLETRQCQVEGVATFQIPRPEPGPLRLRIERRKDDDVEIADFAFFILPGRVTELIIEQSVQGTVRITQASPVTHPNTQVDIEYVAAVYQMERDLQDGPFDRAPLLYAKAQKFRMNDPVCLAVGADILAPQSRWRRPQPSDVEERTNLANTLLEVARDLPDGHVLLGVLAEQAGRQEEAAAHYLDALKLGLPILSSNLKLLLDGAARCHVDHPRRGLVIRVWDHLLPGPLWTAWRPQA